MVNWSRLVLRIPTSLQVSKNTQYDILWIPKFKRDHVGETWFHKHLILLKLKESAKETIHTYLHEVLHAVSDEYDVGLTEKQILGLEKAIYYLLKPGNLFTKGE